MTPRDTPADRPSRIPVGEWDGEPRAFARNPDGTYSPATPLGYYPGIDWEVYAHPHFPLRAVAYRADRVLVTVGARTRFGLWARIAWATATRCGWTPREPVRVLR